MRARVRPPAAAALLLLLVDPGRAGAGPAAGLDAAIDWSAPPECPGEAALRAEVERLLARPLGRSGASVRVIGEVTRDGGAAGRYQLRLVIAVRAGLLKERRLEGETCAQVVDAAAVVLALALDAEPVPEDPPAPPVTVAPPPPEPVEEHPRAEAAPASIRPAWDLAAIGGADFLSLPAPALGVGLSLAWNRDADRVAFEAVAWLPRSAAAPGRPSVGGEVSLYAAGLRYCRWLLRGSFTVAPCGGIEAGAMLATAAGAAVTPAPTGVGRWLAPQIGLLGAFRPTPRFALSLAVDGLAPTFRDVFAIAGAGAVYRPPPATLRALLGVHVRFP